MSEADANEMEVWKGHRVRDASGAGRDAAWAISIVLSCIFGVFMGSYWAITIFSQAPRWDGERWQALAQPLKPIGLDDRRSMQLQGSVDVAHARTDTDAQSSAATPQAHAGIEPSQPAKCATDPAEVRAALLLESEEAYAQSLRMYPEVHLYPALGPVDKITPPAKRGETLLGKYHVMNTAGCELRGRWQTLINYYSYKKQKADYPASSMGGYTRVLHCEEPDDIMHLVPTLRVDPLPDDIVTGYPVLNRPWGLVQWLSRMHIQEEYILMTETDQIFLAPPPMLATRERPSTYPFTYVDCTNSQFRPFCEDPRFNENQVPVELVKPIGNTPMIISVEMMLEMVPRWDRVARRIHADEAANRELGWIQEMFAVALALANTPGGPTDLLVDKCTMFQPPHEDLTIDMEKETRSVACQTDPNQRFVNISVLHYTYSSFMDAGGHPVSAGAARWQFNKRLFSEASPPVPFSMPPRSSPEGTRLVIQWMNEVGMSTEMWPWWGAHMHPHWPNA